MLIIILTWLLINLTVGWFFKIIIIMHINLHAWLYSYIYFTKIYTVKYSFIHITIEFVTMTSFSFCFIRYITRALIILKAVRYLSLPLPALLENEIMHAYHISIYMNDR